MKQATDEKISIFAGRIRRNVRGLGVKKLKFDRACIEKLGHLELTDEEFCIAEMMEGGSLEVLEKKFFSNRLQKK